MRKIIKKRLKNIRAARMRLLLRYKDFSIISNNCWGGITYDYFNMKYLSPTVGLIIPPDDYNKFCNNLEKYSKIDVELLDLKESRHKNLFEDLENRHGKLVFGICGDVEICFLHYKTYEDAVNKWNRRFKRINYKNLIFKNNDNNMMTVDDVIEWNKVVADKKSIFITNKKSFYDKCNSNIKILSSRCLHESKDVDDVYCFIKDHKICNLLNELSSIH